jgi:flagellar motor switch protein FliN/FliY
MIDEDQSNVNEQKLSSTEMETGEEITIAKRNAKIPPGEAFNTENQASVGAADVAKSFQNLDSSQQIEAENSEDGIVKSEDHNAPKTDTNNYENLTPLGGNVMSIEKIQAIKVNVQVMLGSISLSISHLASLKKGEIISLDTSISDPIEILANGQLIARGQIVINEEENPKFGISLIEIVGSDITAI